MIDYYGMEYKDFLALFKSGREFLDWIVEGTWRYQLGGRLEFYFDSIRQAVNPVSYDVPIPEGTMCNALERTMKTGEIIEIVPDPEFRRGGAKYDQLDGWTCHIEFLEVDESELTRVPTPPEPPEGHGYY